MLFGIRGDEPLLEICQSLRRPHIPHLTGYRDLDSQATLKILLIDGHHIVLAPRPLALFNHLLRESHEFGSAAEVIQPRARVFRDALLLRHFDHPAAFIDTSEAPSITRNARYRNQA